MDGGVEAGFGTVNPPSATFLPKLNGRPTGAGMIPEPEELRGASDREV